MQCISPITLIKSVPYKDKGITFGLNGLREAFSEDYYSVSFQVPCGKCIACCSQKAKEWTMRLSHEWYYYQDNNSMFLTLTYDNENLPSDYGLHRRDIQLFMKRLRRRLDYKYKIKVKYFCAGEYGFKKSRPHYHLIVFGIPNISTRLVRDINQFSVNYKLRNAFKFSVFDRLIYDCWKKGNIRIGYTSLQSIQYCSLYTLKGNIITMPQKEYFKVFKKEKPFRVMSKGIGKRYTLDNAKNLINNLSIKYNDVDTTIPRSYVRWLRKAGYWYIDDYLDAKSKDKIDKDIQSMYDELIKQDSTIQRLTLLDFGNTIENMLNYYNIDNHLALKTFYQTKLSMKRHNYMIRHSRYMQKKMTRVVLEGEVA